MLRSRALREGSVGLLIIVGVGLFAGLVAWLRDFSLGRTSYQVWIEFEDVAGLEEGTPVTFRGVPVGKVTRVDVNDQVASALVEIKRLDLKIPKDSFVSAQTSALIGDAVLDIEPLVQIASASIPGPLSEDCNDNLILCDGSRIRGDAIASLTDLIISMEKLSNILGDPALVDSIKTTAVNASKATAGITDLTQDLSKLSSSVQGEVGNLSTTLKSAGRAANSAEVAAQSINSAANEFGTVATKAGRLADQASGLIEENRVALADTLNNIGLASNSLRSTLQELQPTLTSVRESDIVRNTEQLTQNIRIASANLRVASAALNDPQSILMLQQTLDSARVTFQNAQKITSDLDQLTGDPGFRQNLLRLVNGLSGLVSSTQQLEQQIAFTQSLSGQPLTPSQAKQMAATNAQLNVESIKLTQELARLTQRLETPDEQPTDPSPEEAGDR